MSKNTKPKAVKSSSTKVRASRARKKAYLDVAAYADMMAELIVETDDIIDSHFASRVEGMMKANASLRKATGQEKSDPVN